MVVDHQHAPAAPRRGPVARIAAAASITASTSVDPAGAAMQLERHGEGRAVAGRAVDRDVAAHQLGQAAQIDSPSPVPP